MRLLFREGLAAGCFLLLQAIATSQVQTPTFRPHVTVVPVDVRVFDRIGHPIDDLRQSDFQIFEDGKRQDIAFFSHEMGSGAASATPSGVAPSAGVATSPAEPRAFLLVLGRGRLEGPSKGLTALIDFVRTQLAPEDRVGVAAYDRISDLTTDHAAVVRLLIRYRDRHGAIENVLSNYLRGLAAVHWDGVTLLPSIQAQIDRLFDVPGLPRFRRLPLLAGPDDDVFGDIRQHVLEAIDLNDPKGRQDLRQLFTCTEFLRTVSGEKHLVFVTDQPPQGKNSWPQVDRLARLASDARIALSTIQTGGLQSHSFKAGTSQAFATFDNTFDEMFSVEAFRGAAKETGGVFSAYQYASTAIQRITQQTASRYVLGYYPPESKTDGTFHKIEVRLMRSDVDLSYRRGYFASDIAARADARAVLSSERVTAAYEDYRTFTDIPIDLTVKAVDRRVDVSLKIDPAAVQFTEHEGRKIATLEVGVAVGRSGTDARGHRQDAVDLSFEPAAFRRLTREKISYSTSVDADADPRGLEVKVVVYDYIADRLGTAVAKIR